MSNMFAFFLFEYVMSNVLLLAFLHIRSFFVRKMSTLFYLILFLSITLNKKYSFSCTLGTAVRRELKKLLSTQERCVCWIVWKWWLMTLDWSYSILKHTHSPACYYSHFIFSLFITFVWCCPCVWCVCVCMYVLAGKGKVKVKGNRTLKGGDDPMTASAAEQRMNPLDSTLPIAGVRSLGGSAPGTPTEAEAAINQSATGSWSRNSFRGSKCNSNSSTLSMPHLII